MYKYHMTVLIKGPAFFWSCLYNKHCNRQSTKVMIKILLNLFSRGKRGKTDNEKKW